MDISRENYQVHYDKTNALVTFHGSFRLHDGEFKPILDLLIAAANDKPEKLTLDVRELRFLNSSGIHTLLKFVLRVREHNASQVVVRGSRQFLWQAKVLKNLQRLLPGLQMEIG